MSSIHQTVQTRRRAVDLLCALRADEPRAGLSELAEVVLCVWLDSRGLTPPQAQRHPQGRPSRLDALCALSRDWLVMPADRRTRALISAALSASGRPLAQTWGNAIDHLHSQIFAPLPIIKRPAQGRTLLYRMAA